MIPRRRERPYKALAITVAVILAALPVLATTLFSDDFNRADNDLLGGNWVERGPSVDFDIVTGRVQVMAYATSLIGVAYNPAGISSADYTVQAIVNPATGDTLTGVCGRRVNFSTADSDGYMAFIHDTANSLFLYKRVSGTWTELGSFAVTITAGTDYTVKLSMQGTTIKAFLDGVERISVTDSSLSAAGDAGLCINGGAENTGMRWDDFLVEDFGAPATPRKRAAVVFAKAHLHQPNREGIK